jgi:phospholipase C
MEWSETAFDRALSRRTLLKGAAILGGSAFLASCVPGVPGGPGHGRIRRPGSRPYPNLPEGTDTLPEIEHIVVAMQENQSYDMHFGLLGRGDGFRLGRDGLPIYANADNEGNLIRSFHLPSTCQLPAMPSQSWNSSHTAFDNGRNDGFVRGSGPVAMGYLDQHDLPFYYGLARTFPLCDRWFCSVLAQTYPNRRFLMAGTAAGVVSTTNEALTAPPPPNGTIFDRFHAHGISWLNYYSNLPSTGIILKTLVDYPSSIAPISQFYTDAAAGTLPSFCIVDPNFDTESEENDADVRVGEQYMSKVVNAVMQGPAWHKTLMIYTYDEHGGYFDHVPPPPAIKPDDIPPDIHVPPDLPGGYDRYGFRVPTVIISPYARRCYVSHVLHDHTSVLKFVETKWNIGALTYRDANADNLFDALDFRRPSFLRPPTLPPPALAAGPDACTPGNPGGPIPPPNAVIPAK